MTQNPMIFRTLIIESIGLQTDTQSTFKEIRDAVHQCSRLQRQGAKI